MPGIFSAFTDAQKAGQEFGDSVAASKDLQQAMQETPKDESGKADLFTTYSKAGQIAMQSGQVRVADKLLKQANEYKGDALKLKLDEMKVQSAQLERFEQHIQGLNTPEEFIDSIKHSELPLDQQMQLMTLAQKDPKQFKELMLKQSMTGKERTQVEMKVLEEQRKKTHDEAEVNHWADQNRIQAINASGKLTPAEKKAEKVEEHTQGRLEKAQDTLTAEKRRIRNLDPKKFDKKAKDELIAQAELDYEEDTASLRKPEAAPTKPDVASVTDVDKNKLISLNKEGKLTKGQKEEFDSHYGPGAADKILGGAKGPAKAEPKEQPKPEAKKELTDEEQLAEDLSKAAGVQERNAIRNDYNIRQDRKAKEAKQKAIAAKGKEKTEATVAKAQKQGLVLFGMSGTQLKFVDPKTGKEVLESEL